MRFYVWKAKGIAKTFYLVIDRGSSATAEGTRAYKSAAVANGVAKALNEAAGSVYTYGTKRALTVPVMLRVDVRPAARFDHATDTAMCGRRNVRLKAKRPRKVAA